MTNQDIFDRYIQIAETLGQMFKNLIEVTIQDHEKVIYSVNKIIPQAKKKSKIIVIKDYEGKNIGSFCISFDISQFEQFQRFLDFFLHSEQEQIKEELEVQVIIDRWLLERGLFVKQLTYKDKKALVLHLQSQGSFKKKGALAAIAQTLQLTRQSIYNYLEKK